MQTTKINGTLTEGQDHKLTLRVWLTDRQKENFCVQKGAQPSGMIGIVIMDGGEESLEHHWENTKGMIKEVA